MISIMRGAGRAFGGGMGAGLMLGGGIGSHPLAASHDEQMLPKIIIIKKIVSTDHDHDHDESGVHIDPSPEANANVNTIVIKKVEPSVAEIPVAS